MSGTTSGAQRVIRELHVPPLVWVLGTCVVLLALLGAYDALISEASAFDLQKELRNGVNFPVLFSGLTLLLAAALCARLAARDVSTRWAWVGLALLFAFMAVDEVFLIHEDLQELADLKWQILYFPLFVVGAFAWVTALRAFESLAERVLWIGGAAAWVIAQLFGTAAHLTEGSDPLRPRAAEMAERTSYSAPLRAVEEVLEFGGTVLFIWALLLLISHRRAHASYRAAPQGGDPLSPASRPG